MGLIILANFFSAKKKKIVVFLDLILLMEKYEVI